jgi:hypothetical protein
MGPGELADAIPDHQRQLKNIKIPKAMLAKAIPTMTELYEWAKDHNLMLKQVNSVHYRTQYGLMKAKMPSICPALYDLLTWSEDFKGARLKDATWSRYVYDQMKRRRVFGSMDFDAADGALSQLVYHWICPQRHEQATPPNNDALHQVRSAEEDRYKQKHSNRQNRIYRRHLIQFTLFKHDIALIQTDPMHSYKKKSESVTKFYSLLKSRNSQYF